MTSSFLSQQLAKVDVVARKNIEWKGEFCFPSEPVFVASPGAVEEDDGEAFADQHGGFARMLIRSPPPQGLFCRPSSPRSRTSPRSCSSSTRRRSQKSPGPPSPPASTWTFTDFSFPLQSEAPPPSSSHSNSASVIFLVKYSHQLSRKRQDKKTSVKSAVVQKHFLIFVLFNDIKKQKKNLLLFSQFNPFI